MLKFYHLFTFNFVSFTFSFVSLKLLCYMVLTNQNNYEKS
jgi:hypothetical protein